MKAGYQTLIVNHQPHYMKKTRLAALSMAILGFYTAIAQMPNGAYKAIETQYGDTKQSKEELSKQSIIKIFKNGYWIAASFGDSAQGFLGSGGGTYKIVNGKYVEKVDFFSWDTTAVGKTYMFDYSLSDDQYSQDGYVNSEKFVNMPIKE